MNTGAWCKLYGNIIYSTVWQEPPEVRVVWITMLALADRDGYVGASVPGLAKAAGVSVDVTEAALDKFGQPDPQSRSQEREGRRIEEAPGGWRILTYQKHREGNPEQRAAWAEAKRRQRSNGKGKVRRAVTTAHERLKEEAQRKGDQGLVADLERIEDAALGVTLAGSAVAQAEEEAQAPEEDSLPEGFE